MTHTPGPWSYWPKSAYPEGVISQDATTTHIAVPVFHPDVNRTTANARLIAAAPEMLATLETVDDYLAIDRGDGDKWRDIRAIIRAAIAKAEGRS